MKEEIIVSWINWENNQVVIILIGDNDNYVIFSYGRISIEWKVDFAQKICFFFRAKKVLTLNDEIVSKYLDRVKIYLVHLEH